MSETKKKILIIVVLLLVILFGVGQFFAGANLNTAQQTTPNQNDTNPLATQVIKYIPDISVLPTSTPVEKGSCFANSIAAPYRTDAWRCTVGNAISDPCFEMPSANGTLNTAEPQLICGANPANTDMASTFILQSAKALPEPEVASGTAPSNWAWLVELTDGTVCSPFTGTLPFTASGDVAYYSCNGPSALTGSADAMIFGQLNNASGTWTAEIGSLSTSTKIFPPVIVASTTAPIFAVWQ